MWFVVDGVGDVSMRGGQVKCFIESEEEEYNT